MRVTLLGHASILVELDGAVCLMDPVFFDPFEEGAVVSYPARVVHPERLPPIDLLVISHRHPDHFDLRSLACVGRGCEVICPADPLIIYALRRLGFDKVHAVEPMGEISTAGFELYPTRSEAPSPREFGMVFRDGSGVFFNQVDTPLSDATIAGILERFGSPDLYFAMYASQNFEFFDSLSAAFPFATHERNLRTVLALAPRVVVPGSAGFRFRGEHAWLNAFLFPISAERFVADLASLAPTIAARLMKPGDTFEIRDHDVHQLDAAAACVATTVDDIHLIDFDPTAAVAPLHDPNPDRIPLPVLTETLDNFVAGDMGGWVSSGAVSDPVLRAYREARARYALGVVFPDASRRWYQFDFSQTALPEVRNSLVGHADITHRLAASALVGWIERRKSFFYVRTYSRRFSTLYRLIPAPPAIRVQPIVLPDLLMHYLLNVAPGWETAARRHVDLELEALAREGYPVAPPP